LTTFADTALTPDDFRDALVASCGHPILAPSDDIYAGLIGTWDVTAHDYRDDGRSLVCRGSWIFARVLEGRAVQDVLILPARGAASHPRQRYGTSIRTFDATARRWQVTWLNPLSGRFDVLHAWVDRGAIVQEGRNAEGEAISWTFDELDGTAFHWTGKTRSAEGRWRLDAEFSGARRI
jgi:hypothetical protein